MGGFVSSPLSYSQFQDLYLIVFMVYNVYGKGPERSGGPSPRCLRAILTELLGVYSLKYSISFSIKDIISSFDNFTNS
jgi:hypothetical protein